MVVPSPRLLSTSTFPSSLFTKALIIAIPNPLELSPPVGIALSFWNFLNNLYPKRHPGFIWILRGRRGIRPPNMTVQKELLGSEFDFSLKWSPAGPAPSGKCPRIAEFQDWNYPKPPRLKRLKRAWCGMDPRYLEFFELFNREEFFEAHEVLEGLWRETEGEKDS